MKRWFYLALWLALALGAGAVGAGFRPDEWYSALHKPAWTPPGWLFGPVWTALYILMAVAAWLVTLHGEYRRRRLPLSFFCLQLAANSMWSWLFFGLHGPGYALADILVLWVILSVTMGLFYKTRRVAGLLLLPYWLWVSFATVLNAEIWRLNG
jgi:tryptophan-rich sensory protein